jgi:Fe-S cluster assembly protein SufD
MIDTMEENTHLANFDRFEKETVGSRLGWLQEIRQDAIERFRELGFPSARNEDWRFTSVAPIARTPFQLAAENARHGLTPEQLDRLTFRAGEGARLVFVNGRYARDLSSPQRVPDGLVVASLAEVLDAHPDWVEPYLARYAAYESYPFTALNTAFIRDGAFVSVPRGTVIAQPIHLIFVSTAPGEAAVSHPRNLVIAGDHSRAAVVESYVGPDESTYFTNAVTEVVADDHAVLDHYKLQREGDQAFHVATLQVHQARGSNVSSHFISLGGALVRNEINAVLDAEGCECTLNGLYMATGRQHVDNHTVIDHARPRCVSHELYKGILDGRAHGVFNGKIFVHQDAQKTDAKQTNQTLLLSDDATINTKPQLEIYADDVKCTHGATVGQLDEEALFYLRSRGIDLAAARSLLTFAFANDVIGRIKIDPLRARLEEVLLAAHHLPPGEEAS